MKFGIAVAIGLLFRVVVTINDRLLYKNQRGKIVDEYLKNGYDVSFVALCDMAVVSVFSIGEEIVYRSWLLLLPSILVWPAAVFSSLVFSWQHYRQFGKPLFFFVFALVLTASLLYLGWWTSAVMHLSFNLGGLAYAFWLVKRSRFSVSRTSND